MAAVICAIATTAVRTQKGEWRSYSGDSLSRTAAAPQTSFWHHVWAASDGRQTLERLRDSDPKFDNVKFIPQYTSPAGGSVDFSSDTFGGFLTTPSREAIELVEKK
jgi:hypothetical protein